MDYWDFDRKVKLSNETVEELKREFALTSSTIKVNGIGDTLKIYEKKEGDTTTFYFNTASFFDPDCGFIKVMATLTELYLLAKEKKENIKFKEFYDKARVAPEWLANLIRKPSLAPTIRFILLSAETFFTYKIIVAIGTKIGIALSSAAVLSSVGFTAGLVTTGVGIIALVGYGLYLYSSAREKKAEEEEHHMISMFNSLRDQTKMSFSDLSIAKTFATCNIIRIIINLGEKTKDDEWSSLHYFRIEGLPDAFFLSENPEDHQRYFYIKLIKFVCENELTIENFEKNRKAYQQEFIQVEQFTKKAMENDAKYDDTEKMLINAFKENPTDTTAKESLELLAIDVVGILKEMLTVDPNNQKAREVLIKALKEKIKEDPNNLMLKLDLAIYENKESY